jgi:hypothetical protein
MVSISKWVKQHWLKVFCGLSAGTFFTLGYVSALEKDYWNVAISSILGLKFTKELRDELIAWIKEEANAAGQHYYSD